MYRSAIPLLTSIFFLMAVVGSINIITPINLQGKAMPFYQIGIIMSIYNIGMVIGTTYGKSWIQNLGFVRCFISSACVFVVFLIFSEQLHSAFAIALSRLLYGISAGGMVLVLESWLYSLAEKPSDRGKVFSTYHLAAFLGNLVGYGSLSTLDSGALAFIYVALASLMLAAMFSVCFTQRLEPTSGNQETPSIGFYQLFRTSPLSFFGISLFGVSCAGYLAFAPLMLKAMGLGFKSIAFFMVAGFLGSLFFQYPAGKLSDTMGRRKTLFLVLASFTVITLSTWLLVMYLGPRHPWMLYVAGFLFFGLLSCVYPISSCDAYDRTEKSTHVQVTSRLTVVHALSQMFGALFFGAALIVIDLQHIFVPIVAFVLLLVLYLILSEKYVLHIPAEEKESFQMQYEAATPTTVSEGQASSFSLTYEAKIVLNAIEKSPSIAPELLSMLLKENSDQPSVGANIAQALSSLPEVPEAVLATLTKEAPELLAWLEEDA